MIDSRYAFLRLEAPGWRRTVSAHAPAGRRELEQVVLLTPDRRAAAPPLLLFHGRLDRPAFAEITEVSPLPPLDTTTTLSAAGRSLRIEAPGLPASAEVRVSGGGPAWEIADNGARLALGDVELEVRITCSLE
jgi:hypothetical protein